MRGTFDTVSDFVGTHERCGTEVLQSLVRKVCYLCEKVRENKWGGGGSVSCEVLALTSDTVMLRLARGRKEGAEKGHTPRDRVRSMKGDASAESQSVSLLLCRAGLVVQPPRKISVVRVHVAP